MSLNNININCSQYYLNNLKNKKEFPKNFINNITKK